MPGQHASKEPRTRAQTRLQPPRRRHRPRRHQPVGNDKQTAWSNLVNGVSGIGEITKFDTSPYEQRAAGEVKGFTATEWLDAKAVRRSEPALWYGVAAAKQAVADAGLEIDDENRTEIGVVFGSGAGGQVLMIDNWTVLREKGP